MYINAIPVQVEGHVACVAQMVACTAFRMCTRCNLLASRLGYEVQLIVLKMWCSFVTCNTFQPLLVPMPLAVLQLANRQIQSNHRHGRPRQTTSCPEKNGPGRQLLMCMYKQRQVPLAWCWCWEQLLMSHITAVTCRVLPLRSHAHVCVCVCCRRYTRRWLRTRLMRGAGRAAGTTQRYATAFPFPLFPLFPFSPCSPFPP